MWGKSEHLTLKKKNPTSRLKTYLLGLETGSRIFGTMISAKNGENLLQINFKMALNNFRCSDIPPFTVTNLDRKTLKRDYWYCRSTSTSTVGISTKFTCHKVPMFLMIRHFSALLDLKHFWSFTININRITNFLLAPFEEMVVDFVG